MSFVDAFLASPLAARLGWVFLHFLWQGALIAGALWLVLTGLGQRRAQARYVASCAALGLMLVAPVATFFVLSEPQTGASLQVLMAALEEGAEIAPARGWDWHALVPVLAIFWLFGTLVQQARLLYLWWGTERLRHAFQAPLSLQWQRTVADMRERLGIRVPVRAVECAAAEVPTVVGWLAPVILVPTSALLQLSTEQLRMVLAHELAHVRRHDYLVNLVQTAVESLLFFHPAVWWISHRLRVEREYCCDDVAVALEGNALVFARALERLETLREREPRLALASTGGSLMQRIQRLVKPESTARKSLTLGFLPVVVLLAGALSSTAFGFAGNLTGGQDERKLSDDELERRIVELKRQIEELEVRLKSTRPEASGAESRHWLRVQPRRELSPRHEVHVEPRHEVHAESGRDARVHVEPRHEVHSESRRDARVHVEPRHEVHAESRRDARVHVEPRHEAHSEPRRDARVQVEPRVRKFDVRFGDGDQRTIEVQIPRIHMPEVRFGPDGEERFEVRIPELHFGPEEGHRFEVQVPDIDFGDMNHNLELHMENLHGKLEQLDFSLGDGDEEVLFFSEDFEFDPEALHGKLERLHEVDVEGIHEHIRDAMKNLKIHGLENLEGAKQRLRIFDEDALHELIEKNLEGLHEAKGGAIQGMKFLFEIDTDNPEGETRAYRWSSKDGEEPGEEPNVWFWRSDEGDVEVHERKDVPHGDDEHGRGVGIDWKRYDGSKDA